MNLQQSHAITQIICWLSFCFFFCFFSTVNKDGFKPNLETHLIPLLSTKLEETLESKEKSTASSLKPAHHPLLMQVSRSVFLQ
jgi:hypothetical protein